MFRLLVPVVAAVAGAVVAAILWFTVSPVFARAVEIVEHAPGQAGTPTRLGAAMPLVFVFEGLVTAAIIYLVVSWLVTSTTSGVGRALTQLAAGRPGASLDSHGVSPALDAALERIEEDLRREREVARAQLDSLQKAHRETLRLQTELVATDRLATVGKLASGIAHEVGNPLAGLAGYLSILGGRLGDRADLADLVKRAEAEVQRIDGIVRALLELGRPSRGEAEVIDTRPVVDSSIQLLGASAEMRGVTMTVRGATSQLARAEAGPLAQVIVNLLLNAAQAMGGQGELEVELEERGDRACIRVADRGPGISPDVLPRLFELFFTTKAPGKGTGLGLAMSRHLLAQFGGSLDAENRPGGGALFTISLPRPRS